MCRVMLFALSIQHASLRMAGIRGKSHELEQAPMSEGFKPSTAMSAVLVKERLHDIELFNRQAIRSSKFPASRTL